MNRATSATLIALAVVVVAFVATWLTIPSGAVETHNLATGEWGNRLAYPAALFRVGLRERSEPCSPSGPRLVGCDEVVLSTDLDTVRSRVKVFYGGAAVVVVLVGVAFGAFRRQGSK